jgi:cell wall-associated NlpC family hydrolase
MKRQLLMGLTLIFGFILLFGQHSKAGAETNELSKGVSSKAVTQLQLKLKEQGLFNGDATGYFGSETENALKNYQKQNNLHITGTFNNETSQKLFKVSLVEFSKSIENGKLFVSDSTKTFIKRQISTIATKYQGVPYHFGGTSTKGFDCSGYVGYVYKEAGVKLPRTAESMYKMRSVVKLPVAGDLVFFKNTYKVGISHVGIYLGNNKFISATSSKGVAIVSLANTYWNSKYAGTFSII